MRHTNTHVQKDIRSNVVKPLSTASYGSIKMDDDYDIADRHFTRVFRLARNETNIFSLKEIRRND